MDLASFISLNKAFGFESLSIENDLDDLKSSHQEAKRIEADIRLIKDDIDLELHEGTKTIYCTDFDVIASATDWRESSSQNSYWASLIFHFPRLSLFLLPGTLYEINSYIRKKKNRIDKLNTFESAFLDLTLKAMSDEGNSDEANQKFNSIIGTFKSTHLNSRELYILNILKKKIDAPENHTLPPIDQDFLYYSIDCLSMGARVDKSINNRIDAINYSLCHALNMESFKSGNRYILVSDTRAMHKLNQIMKGSLSYSSDSHYFDSGFVRSSRTTALELLIRKIGRSIAGSEALCYKLLEDIAQYIRKISDLIVTKRQAQVGSDKRAIAVFEGNNPFVNLVSSIEHLQNELAAEKEKSKKIQLSFYDHQFGKNPSDFYMGLEKQIDNLLRRSSFKRIFEDVNVGRTTELKLEVNSDPKGFSFIQERTASDKFENVVAVSRDYKKFSQYIIPGNAPLPQFISVYNLLSSNISAEIARGIYHDAMWNSDEGTLTAISESTGEIRSLEIGSRTDLTLVDVSEMLGIYPAEIDLLRFDNPVFSFSHEKDFLVLSTKFSISREIMLLFEKLTSARLGLEGAGVLARHLSDNSKSELHPAQAQPAI